MSDERQCWQVVDERDGHFVSVTSYFTEAQAWAAIRGWEDRAARGKRPDTAYLVGHMRPIRIH